MKAVKPRKKCYKCGGKQIIHQIRNGKRQYKCKVCGSYSTERSAHNRTANSSILDEFLVAYSKKHYKAQKDDLKKDIKIADILRDFPDVYKSTVYRNRFRVGTLAVLCTWFRKSGVISDWSYKNFNLRIWYRENNPKDSLTLEISVSKIPHKDDCISIEYKAGTGVFSKLKKLTTLTFVKENEYEKISHTVKCPVKEEDLHHILHHFRSLLNK